MTRELEGTGVVLATEGLGVVLATEGLGVVLGERRVLHEVTVGFAAGRVHAVLGPNGAGKTTLLRSLLGVLRPASGRVTRHGAVGYVPQRQETDWDYPVTVLEVVRLGLIRRLGLVRAPRASDHAAVAEALARVRMADLRNRPIGELSGGQRQRAMIARALVVRPRVLLLDEPFTGLDMPSQHLLSELFTELAGQGCAVVMSTHDLTHALHVADDVTLLNRTVIASGEPAAVRDPDLWCRTFEVGPGSPLLRQVGALMEAPC